MGRKPGWREAVDLAVALERRRDHPEDGERHHDEQRDSDDVPAEAVDTLPAAHSLSRPQHLPHVEDAQHGHDREHEDRDCGAAAEVGLPVALHVEVDAHQVVARVLLAGADQEVRLSECAEVPDDGQAGEDQQQGRKDGQRHVLEDAPRARPVDLRRLDELTRHLRERGVDGDRDERKPGPNDQSRHHGVLRERRRVPVVLEEVADMQFGEHVVEDAVLEVGHPAPDLDRDHLRHRPHEDERTHE